MIKTAKIIFLITVIVLEIFISVSLILQKEYKINSDIAKAPLVDKKEGQYVFTINPKRIYFGNTFLSENMLRGVDYNSFEVIDNNHAKDKNRYYVANKSVSICSVASSTQINDFVCEYKDKYYWNLMNRDSLFLGDKDNINLKDLGSNFLQINNSFYCERNKIKDEIKNFKKISQGFFNFDGVIYNKNCKDVSKIFEHPEFLENLGECYFRDKDFVYIDDGMRAIDSKYKSSLKDVDPNFFIDLSSYDGFMLFCYGKDKNIVYYKDKVLEGVDPKSFEVLGRGYSKDNKNVFYYSSKIDGLDVASAELVDIDHLSALGHDYIKDKNSIYYKDKKLEGIDPRDFMVLDNRHSKAIYVKNYYGVYYNEDKIVEADKDSFVIIDKDDKSFSKDNYNVYLKGKVISGADPKTFKVKDNIYPYINYYSEDKDYIYINYEKINGIDRESFEIIYNGYSKDNKNVFYYSRKIDTANPNDFIILKNGYSRSVNMIFFEDKKMENVDIESFKVLDGYSVDNNNIYISGEIVSDININKLKMPLGEFKIECNKKLSDMINNKSYHFYINGCDYNNGVTYKPRGLFDNPDCSDSLEEELKRNEYNFVNGCLYHNEDRVFQYNLFLSEKIDMRGEDIKEWFRFKDKNKLFIFLRSGAGCGGCIYNGPYLVIDLNSGDVQVKNADLPYLPHLVLSPDKKSAIEFTYNSKLGDTGDIIGDIKLYLYDFIKLERTSLVYEIPENYTIVSMGHGFYLQAGSVVFLDDTKIGIQLYEKNERGTVKQDYSINEHIDISFGDQIVVNIFDN